MIKIIISAIIALFISGCGNTVYSSEWQKAEAICEGNKSKVFKVNTSLFHTSLVLCNNMKYYVLPRR
jgi:predicted nucleic-acid-binding Zn-ribbon protein